MTKIVCGIDVSKDHLDTHVDGADRQFSNNSTGLRSLGKWLHEVKVDRVVMEATGRYHRAAHRSLYDRGHEVILVNPYRSRQFARCMGQFAKTDRVDATMLAKFGEILVDLPATPPRSAELNRLEDLLVIREQHVDMRASLRQSANAVEDDTAKEIAKDTISLVAGKIELCDKAIKDHIVSIPELADRYRILISVPGIGPVTAAALCCWMPELGHIGNRQAAALIGVAPFADDSGKSSGARHIRGGRRRPRDVLYMAAMTASQHNPDLTKVFERLKQAGKEHKVAIVAVMRKLVILANVLLRGARTWSPEPPASAAAAR